jgi:hypothetical protein
VRKTSRSEAVIFKVSEGVEKSSKVKSAGSEGQVKAQQALFVIGRSKARKNKEEGKGAPHSSAIDEARR